MNEVGQGVQRPLDQRSDPLQPRARLHALHAVLLNDLNEVEAVCREVGCLLASHGLAGHAFAVDLLLREFVNNAMVHGNGLSTDKRVHVAVRIRPGWVVLRVADEGPGFDWRAQSRVAPKDTAVSGRGLPIGAAYARHVRFNRVGNRVVLWIETTDE